MTHLSSGIFPCDLGSYRFKTNKQNKHKQLPLPSTSQCFLPAAPAPLSSPHRAAGERLRLLNNHVTSGQRASRSLWGSVPGPRPAARTGRIRHGLPGCCSVGSLPSQGTVTAQGTQAEEKLRGKVRAVREKAEVRTWLRDSVPHSLPSRPGVTLTRQTACCLR